MEGKAAAVEFPDLRGQWLLRMKQTAGRAGIVCRVLDWGMVKVRPAPHGRLGFNDPPTAIGVIRSNNSAVCSLDLTIHRLPSVGFGRLYFFASLGRVKN